MGREIEVRIAVIPRSGIDVYFWQDGRRSKTLYLYGDEEEFKIGDNPVTESLFAWAKLEIQRNETSEGKMVWEVVYKSNVVGGEIHIMLQEIKRKIEAAIRNRVEARMDITDDLDDLKVSGWDIVIPIEE